MALKQETKDGTKKTAVGKAAERNLSLPQDYRDVSNQEIFKNHVLCAQFLRNYSNCKALANVQPEDIEDISERFTSIMGTKVEGDTIKRIRLKNPGGEEQEFYAVSLIEHKSDVDYDVAMQLLHYISNIWRDYARSRRYQTEHGDWVEANKARAFRYPPILPIVYYEGIDRWTAGLQLRDRVLTVEGLENYIPNFAYNLVGIRDYDNEELLDRADEMSLIMLLNKIQTAEDLHRMLDVPEESINRIVSNSPEHVLEIILDVVYLLCRKVNLSGDETHEMLSQLKEGRNMGYLFENMEHMDIQEERRKTREAREELEQTREELERVRAENREILSQLKEGRNMGYLFENMEHMDIQEERRKTREAREELEQARKELEQYRKQTEAELTRTQTELATVLKELERYRAAEKGN